MNVDIARAWETGDTDSVGMIIVDLHGNEAMLISRALKYYTDKRKLPFDERMKAGEMARMLDKGVAESSIEITNNERRQNND